MFSFSAFLLVSSFNLWILLSAEPCLHKPVFTPSSLVVRFGQPASAVCSVCEQCAGILFNLEVAVGRTTKNGTNVFWEVDSLTEWGMSPICFYNREGDPPQCTTEMHITLYQPPDNVSIRFAHDKDTLLAGQTYSLECAVQQVAPIKNLKVTFYKGLEPLAERTSTREDKKPADETFTLSFNASEEDDGAKYWCQAQLDLTVQPVPPVVSSQILPASVQYQPRLTSPSSPDVVPLMVGDPLELNCSAVGNPSPFYTWTHLGHARSLSNTSVYSKESVSVADEGLYSCTVTNSMGTATVNFNVRVKENNLMYIIGGVIVAVVVLLAVIYGIYSEYYKSNFTGHYSFIKSVSCCRTHTPVSTAA